MSLSTIWVDVGVQWDYINAHTHTLLHEVFTQADWILNNLAAYRGLLFQNQSKSISELEQLTYNAVWMIELTLDSLVEAVDLSVEARFRGLESVFNDHLETISDFLKAAIIEVEASGSMDYDYVDTEIYWATYDINAELDSLQSQIDAITGVSLTEVEDLIEDAVTELETVMLLNINAVKNSLLGEIDNVYDYADAEVLALARTIDTMIEIERAYVVAQAASIKAYVDSLGGDITGYIDARLNAAKRYMDNQIVEVMSNIDVGVNDLRTELVTQITTLETDLNTKREKVVEDLVVYIVNTELRIHDQITVVSATVSTLTDATTWRAGFFDIFRSNPELSFLQVLLRDKEKFAEFKPYWQALFTRVMAED